MMVSNGVIGAICLADILAGFTRVSRERAQGNCWHDRMVRAFLPQVPDVCVAHAPPDANFGPRGLAGAQFRSNYV